MFVPKIAHNLFSVRMAALKGVDFVVKNNGKQCMFLRNEKLVAMGLQADNLYRIILRAIQPVESSADVYVTSNAESIHVQTIMKQFVVELTSYNEICEECEYGKNQAKFCGS